MKQRRKWGLEVIEEIRKLYPDKTNKELAEVFGTTEAQILNIAAKYSFRKSDSHFAKQKALTCFKKGSEPHNKGKPMPEYVKDKVRSTMFWVGQKPHNTKHDGYITRRNYKGVKYDFIRISEGKWKSLALYIWEKEHGAISKGEIIQFKNKDTLDVRIENLELISRKEQMDRHSATKNLKDGFVLNCLIGVNNKSKEEIREQRKLFSKHPELIELKRNQLKLKRQCQNQAETN